MVRTGDNDRVAAFQGQIVAADPFMLQDEIRIECFTDDERRIRYRLRNTELVAAAPKSFDREQTDLIEGQRLAKRKKRIQFFQPFSFGLKSVEDLLSTADLALPLFFRRMLDIFIKMRTIQIAVVDEFRPETFGRFFGIVKA